MSDEIGPLDISTLREAVGGSAAALRCVLELQPAGGPGDKVFPPTYQGGRYAFEERLVEGRRVPCVVLDSVASQANRIELALLRAYRRREISLPLVEVDFSPHFPDLGRVSALEAPHRIADAILRDSTDADGTRFRDTQAGRSFTDASAANATGLFTWCPTALVFGMWDSTGPKGGLGAKFARCLVSEVVGYDVVPGVRSSSRIDPLQIQLKAGPLYEAQDGWTLDEALAVPDAKGKPAKLGKDGKPSEANHGNVTPSLAEGAGGVTLSRALLTTTVSLPGLRRLCFPIDGNDDEERNDAARTVLAALGLFGAVLAQAEGLDLRSRCHLVPTAEARWEVIGAAGQAPAIWRLGAAEAKALLAAAVRAAAGRGLAWPARPVCLMPRDDLVSLVKASRELAAASAEPTE